MLSKVVTLVCLFALARGCERDIKRQYIKTECYDSIDGQIYHFSTLRAALAETWNADIQNSALEITNNTLEEIQKLDQTFISWKTGQENQISQALEQNNAATFNSSVIINQEIIHLQDKFTNWKTEQETHLTQVLAEQSAAMTKLVLYVAGIVVINSQLHKAIVELQKSNDELNKSTDTLQKSNSELQQAVEQLKAGAKNRGFELETYTQIQGLPVGTHDAQDVKDTHQSFIKTICMIRDAVGISLPETCRQILYPQSSLDFGLMST